MCGGCMDKVKNHRGRKPKLGSTKRNFTVSSRFNALELADLDAERRHMQRGAFLRHVWQGSAPMAIPELNRSAWLSLAKAIGNLNQYQRAINVGMAQAYPAGILEGLTALIIQLRNELVGGIDEAEEEV